MQYVTVYCNSCIKATAKFLSNSENRENYTDELLHLVSMQSISRTEEEVNLWAKMYYPS